MNNLLQESPIIVKILGEDDGYWNPGMRTTCKGRLCSVDSVENPQFYAEVNLIEGEEDRTITVYNFRNNKPLVGAHYLAYLVGGIYLLDSQGDFGAWIA